MTKKHILDIDEKLWREVRSYQFANNIKYVNTATVTLIEKGLGVKK